MKLLVISDTHRLTWLAADLIGAIKDVDHIIHLGDLVQDAAWLAEHTGRPVISVKGNCDMNRSGDDARVLETECGSILLVHGHNEHVKTTLEILRHKAKEAGCVAAFYGHTHEAHLEESEGITLMNPGSVALPKDGGDPSYAIAHTGREGITASIIYLTRELRGALERASRQG
ncbi:MAG: metallophosphoesterase [Clostridiales Family XIII bacterium]|jgi:putative phosphoesterase|nr:metallophosphoesterase [Clostridiales Family XIII bacterium]